MKILLSALIVAVAFVSAAVDPAWPSDFDVNLQTHLASVVATRTTSGTSVMETEFEARTQTSAATAGYGSELEPFESRTFTRESSNRIGLDTSKPSFVLFLR